MPRYLDPKADIVFKKIFGEHPHLLKSFLNAVLPLAPDELINSLEYLSGEQVPPIPAFKYTIVDVKCTDLKGRVFIVEMQMDWVGSFMQRMLFNAASAYVRQLWKGETYDLLCPVYGLGIVGKAFEADDPSWYHHYQIVNIKNPVKRIEGLELIFIELPKFKPLTRDEKRLRVLWLRFLSELDEETDTIPQEFLEVPEIQEACQLAQEAAYTPGELEGYHKYWDAIRTAKTIAKTIAHENFHKGREEGILLGKAEGIAEGILRGKLEAARSLLACKLRVSEVATMLGIPPEKLEQLHPQETQLTDL